MKLHVKQMSTVHELFQHLGGIDKVTASVLRSEAYRLNEKVRSYARGTDFGPFAPATVGLRKGSGYGPWFAKFTRYYVDPKNLTAQIGLLTKADMERTHARIRPISMSFARSAMALQKGYTVEITRKEQAVIAKRLQAKYGQPKRARSTTSAAHYGRMWARLLYGSWHRMVPRLGTHTVKPRPIIPVIWEQEEPKLGDRIASRVMARIMGGGKD
jgi:hypothetical protein